MKQKDIIDLPRLKNENFENIFNVYATEEGQYYYNLLQTVVFPQNLPDGYFDFYDIEYGDTWPYISYKVYNSTGSWWIILLANNINNPITSLVPGTRIKVPKMRIVKLIISQITTQQN